MISGRHLAQSVTIGIAGLVLLSLVVSCVPQLNLAPSPSTTVTPDSEASLELTATPSQATATTVAQPVEVLPTESPAPPSLTLWTVEAVSPQAAGEAGRIFNNGLKAFQTTYPNVSVTVVLKNESGKGSVLDYLRTASLAAPTVLPDVVVLNTDDLSQLARSGLAVPLDALISPALIDDLLPAARAAGSVGGQLVGIPFEMDVEHLIYNTNKVSTTPMVWTDVISANTNYVFPAKGRNGLVNDAFLIQYLALGGRLQDDEGQPFLDGQALQAVLEYYHQGVQEGVVSPDILNVGTPDEIWPSYVSAEVGIAHVTSHQFLRDRSVLQSTQFAAIPTHDATPLSIGRGQALVIVGQDPNRQEMAAHLIEWLMAPENNAAWNQATTHLPTRYSVFEKIGDSDPYWPFLQRQLEVAVPPPTFPEYDQIGRVLQQAVIEVLSEEATPEEAATAAVAVITP